MDFAQLLRTWKALCSILMQVAEWEAEVISERTRGAMAAGKEKPSSLGFASGML